MQKVHVETTINAPREKVWHVMLDHPTYEQWTAAFQPGSTYQGTWDEGAEIKFVDGSGNGMIGKIKESKPGESMVIGYEGAFMDGKTITEGWAGAEERYTFTDADGGTHLKVEIDVDEKYKAMFEEMWPRALVKLKELCEK